MRHQSGSVIVEYVCICCVVTIIVGFIIYFTFQILAPVILAALQQEIYWLNKPYWIP